MDIGANNDELGGELWGLDDMMTRHRDLTDGSDFTPTELAMMHRQNSKHVAPLPQGVPDVHWQPPASTGLKNSTAIFATERDTNGGLMVTTEGISESNCHFRSWQEDNGVARSFGVATVEKDVDGQRRMVAVSSTPMLANSLVPENTTRPSSADWVLENKKVLPGSSDSTAPQDIRRRKGTMRRFPSGDKEAGGGEDRKPSGKIVGKANPPSDEGAAGSSLPGVDGASQQGSETPGDRSVEAVSDSKPGHSCARPSGGVVGASLSTTNASSGTVSSMPQRPPDGVARSQTRETRPGQRITHLLVMVQSVALDRFCNAFFFSKRVQSSPPKTHNKLSCARLRPSALLAAAFT